MNVHSGNHMVAFFFVLDWIVVLMHNALLYAWKVVKFKFNNVHGLYLRTFY